MRYLVVDTRSWLPGRLVLISPMSVRGAALADRVDVTLTRDQVENSPPVDAEASRTQKQLPGRKYRSAGSFWRAADG